MTEGCLVRIATPQEEASGNIPPGSVTLKGAMNTAHRRANVRICSHGVSLEYDCAECSIPVK